MYKNQYDILLEKLDEFIRKYYKNLLIRGLIYGIANFLFFFLLVSLLEYFGRFDTGIRTILFYSFILINTAVAVKLIFIPLAKLFRMGNVLSHEQAAQIIGTHFKEIQDRLLNVLQLKKQQLDSPKSLSPELIEAGINQKINELKPIPFSGAVDFGANRKYIKYAAAPLLILILILFANKNIITGSTTRLIEHRTYFEKPAPFSFNIQNKSLETVQQEDYILDVKINGNTVPDAAYIETDGARFKLEKDNAVSFHYVFKNIQKSASFRFFADGYYSKTYELKALPNPVVLGFDLDFEYPAYLHKSPDQMRNSGDITVPEGTKVSWSFSTKNTEHVRVSFSDTSFVLNRRGENNFFFSKKCMRTEQYSVSTSNAFMRNKDSISYSLSVIPDLFPSIEVDEQADSLSSRKIYFRGIIKDDYGFSRLSFHYRITNRKDSSGNGKDVALPLQAGQTGLSFYYLWDMNEMNIQAGDDVEYFFSVWDNDGINGPKAGRSQARIYKAPTLRELTESTDKKSEEIKNQMKESIREAKAIQKELRELDKKIMEKKNLSWEEKKKAQDLISRQNELQKNVENIKRENEKKDIKQDEFKKPDSEIAQKHEELKKLMDQLITEEMKKQLEDLQKLLSKTDKQKLQEEMDKMKLANKDLEKELDRALELFKKMEVEQKLKEAAQNLEKLAMKQDELSKETLDKNAPPADLEKKQDELNKEFQDLKKDLKDLEKKNEALEDPKDIQNTDGMQQDIEQQMNNSKSELSQNKKQKASKSQKDASDKMNNLASKLNKMKEDSEEEQAEEDMESIRALLENLLRLSFDQEKLMADMKVVSPGNPQYLKMAQEQRKLKEDAKMIEDSLFALSKRVAEIQSMVNREIALVNDNMEKAIDYYQERQIPMLVTRQQMVMTSVNNLALMLAEALDQMQQKESEQQSKKQGKSSCKKPGGACKKPGNGKPSSASQMKKMQEALNKQMEALQESLKSGKKPGNNQVPGAQGMSEQLARMAAQQEMLRKELQRYDQENNKDAKGSLGNLRKIAEEMEQTEKDLVNKQITSETMRRQQDIFTRLLEAEKAERERDQDDKRESKEGKNEIVRNPDEFASYKRLKEKEMELLKTVPPSFSPYYRRKVDDYFRTLEN